jgi:hypothetical protein
MKHPYSNDKQKNPIALWKYAGIRNAPTCHTLLAYLRERGYFAGADMTKKRVQRRRRRSSLLVRNYGMKILRISNESKRTKKGRLPDRETITMVPLRVASATEGVWWPRDHEH